MFSIILLFACRNLPNKQPDQNYAFELHTSISNQIFASAESSDGALLYSTGEQLWQLSNNEKTATLLDTSSLPAGDIVFVDSLHSQIFVYVYGKGLFTKEINADTDWEVSDLGLTAPLLTALNPYSSPFPMAMAEDSNGLGWMATAGGLFGTIQDTNEWSLLDTSSSGDVNPLFSDLAIEEDTIAAVSLLPASILPSQYSGLLTGTVFQKEGESEWESIGDSLPSIYTS